MNSIIYLGSIQMKSDRRAAGGAEAHADVGWTGPFLQALLHRGMKKHSARGLSRAVTPGGSHRVPSEKGGFALASESSTAHVKAHTENTPFGSDSNTVSPSWGAGGETGWP